MALLFLRRFYYLFLAEFRWIASLAVILAGRWCMAFRSERWTVTAAVCAANVVLVSVLGGAELERYLLPVLPVFYIAVAVALTVAPRVLGIVVSNAMLVGLAVNVFWNPPYPFPYENNYAMVDFVRLQKIAAEFAEPES